MACKRSAVRTRLAPPFFCGVEMRVGDIIIVSDKMQTDYRYELSAPTGRNYAGDFSPHFTPRQMLSLGIFEGRYCNDCTGEFPSSWFSRAKTSTIPANANNYFRVKSRLSLSEWQKRGWIIEPDPRGWFQWYCRYYLGRRLPEVDKIQIKRWRAFRRHAGQIKANCDPGDIFCRPRQRQALLQWSHDPFI